MSNLQNELNRVVAGFVSQVTELARRAAIDTLEGALGKRVAVVGGRGVKIGSRRGGGKRSAAQLDKLADTFRSYVAKHPGLRIEQINKELGTTTTDLALPIRKLIADGEIKTKGQKRSTMYFAKA